MARANNTKKPAKEVTSDVGFVISIWIENGEDPPPFYMTGVPRVGEVVEFYESKRRFEIVGVEHIVFQGPKGGFRAFYVNCYAKELAPTEPLDDAHEDSPGGNQ